MKMRKFPRIFDAETETPNLVRCVAGVHRVRESAVGERSRALLRLARNQHPHGVPLLPQHDPDRYAGAHPRPFGDHPQPGAAGGRGGKPVLFLAGLFFKGGEGVVFSRRGAVWRLWYRACVQLVVVSVLF